MRLQIFSDFHIDVAPGIVPRLADGVDVIVVAGDVCEGIGNGMGWLRHHLGDRLRIVFVAGNHEYFARVRQEERAAGAQAARAHGIEFLDDAEVMIGRLRIIGSSLWADYGIFGVSRREEMMAVARRRMMDHRRIFEAPGRYITPEEELALHRAARTYIEHRLAEVHVGPTIVVTHHAPHPESLAQKYRENLISAAFISDLSEVIAQGQPAFWIHGHTHVSLNYRVGGTRIICNPHGYDDENPDFDPSLVIEI